LLWINGQLEKADSPAGPWSPVLDATSPWSIDPSSPQKFYRLRFE
jgi:hypothetical protein